MPYFNSRTPGAEIVVECGESTGYSWTRHLITRGPRGGAISLCGRRQRTRSNRWGNRVGWYLDCVYLSPNDNARHRDWRRRIRRTVQCHDCRTRLDECFASL